MLVSRVTSAVSGKTNYLLRGRDAGETKLAKAKSLGTKVLDEEGFYNLVESSAPKKEEIAIPPPAASPVKTEKKGNQPAASTSSIKT